MSGLEGVEGSRDLGRCRVPLCCRALIRRPEWEAAILALIWCRSRSNYRRSSGSSHSACRGGAR
jgi:hypothetical protein